MTKYIGYILSATILTLGVIGARLQSNTALFIMLAVIILALALVVFNKVKEKQYPVLIFCITLGLVYQLTLLSNHLVGTDIHYEYYFALQTYNGGYWDYTIGHSYNSAVSISVFLPMLAKFFHIPLEWAFKVVPPLFLAGIPVVTYYIFKKEFNSKTAFLAVFFFISVPTLFLELSGLAKQAIGELFLIVCLGLVIYNVFNLKRARYVLIGLFAVLTMLSHYSMGGVLFCYLLGAIVLLIIGKYVFKLKPSISLRYLAVTVVIVTVLGGAFYGWVAQGAPLKDMIGSVALTSGIEVAPSSVIDPVTKPDTSEGAVSPLVSPGSPVAGSSGYKHWVYPEPAVKVALGGDFFDVGFVPKIFRILQYITQLLIVIGCIVILKNYKKHSSGFLACFILSGILLGMTAFLPGFSPIFNASRFYSLVLLFMSPAAIIGGKLIFRNYKVLVIAILIPYFVFTSGAVFEMSNIKDLTVISIPYSHALSATRIDSTAVFTENDINVRDWVKANDAFPVYGDMWGSTAMFEVQSNMGTGTLLKTEDKYVYCFVFRENESEPEEIPSSCYMILRERNTEREEITYQVGVGLRKTLSYEEVGFNEVLDDRPIMYQAGNAIVYGPKE